MKDLRKVRISRWDGWRTYRIRIEYHQYFSNGHSPLTVLEYTTPKEVPGPPTIIKLTPLDNAIKVIFTPPLERNGIITKYKVTVEEIGTSTLITRDSDVTSVTIKNLTAYTSYNIKVQPRTSVGWGSFSTIRTLRTLEDTPGSPTEFTVTFQNETTVGIRWKSPNFTRGIIQGYKITYRQRSNSDEKVLFYAFQSAMIEVLITRLEPGEYYHFRVEARSGVGYGPGLNGSTFTFPATPAKPPIPMISYTNQQLTLTLNPGIVTEKHFYMVRVYIDEVRTSDVGNRFGNTGPTGTVILILDKNDLAQSVIYVLGDNTTRHGVQNIILELKHTYIFYIEIVIKFENILRSNYTKYPDSFTIVSQKSLDVTAEKSNESDLAGVVIGVLIVVLLIPGTVSICIVIKRSKTNTETRSVYDGNETTYDWEKAVNLGGTNLMLSASIRRSLDSISGSLLGNTSLIDEPYQNEAIKRSSSCEGEMSKLENRHRQSRRKMDIKKSLSDTDMFQKNNLYREYEKNLAGKSEPSTPQKVQNGYNKRTKTIVSSENEVANNEKVTKKTVPPKPPRHRLRRSATESNFEELKRRACSPIVEEDFDEMMKNIDKISHQHNKILSSYAQSEKISSVDRNRNARSKTSDLDSTNFSAMDIGTQTSAERGVTKKTKMRRTRKILASKAMSENRRAPTSSVQGRKQMNSKPDNILDSVSTETNVRIESISKENGDDKKRQRIKRKRALQRRAESLRNCKDNKHDYSSKSFSFNERRNFRKFNDFYPSSGSDDEMKVLKPPRKSRGGSLRQSSKAQQQDRLDSIEMENHTNDLDRRVSIRKSPDRRRKKSHSLRETGSTMRGEYREQDVLKFWSKTYSFLDERKILPHEEKSDEYKVTSFYETDRPQTVSLELEFKSLPTGMLGTTNIARQKAGIPSHKLCLESYDHSRVILKPEGPDDYINASYIKDRTRDGCPRYIAARTPHDEPSALKFWRMVLQEGTRVVVKLSQQPDIFPSEITRHAGQVTDRFKLTHCEDISVHECAVRYMKVKNVLDQSSRGLYIIHDLQWPDDDRYYLPQNTKDFISMREVVRKCQGTSLAPIIVHCSQEDGRSGVFIAIDALLLEYEKQREVNIFSFVRNMLKDRYGMIKTVWQYRFIYEALLEAHWQT
ncbi:receptor-type tyrosine-protein phosphatase F-like [Saccostrea echinata]|uniref:receptor-type tyrosine-protein phosphatase F-like n=1 Tax=Saccostrea echinata TaxID=191078 RepID=UPI002A82E757|nr:receptor-type tyrosine-protein phosphatase F-like [Saccostrea echinata]